MTCRQRPGKARVCGGFCYRPHWCHLVRGAPSQSAWHGEPPRASQRAPPWGRLSTRLPRVWYEDMVAGPRRGRPRVPDAALPAVTSRAWRVSDRLVAPWALQCGPRASDTPVGKGVGSGVPAPPASPLDGPSTMPRPRPGDSPL